MGQCKKDFIRFKKTVTKDLIASDGTAGDGILGDQSFGVLVDLHLELILMIKIVNLAKRFCYSMFLLYCIYLL